MPEEQLFKTQEAHTRVEIAQVLSEVAAQIKSGQVKLETATEEQSIAIPEQPMFETELERLTDSETEEQQYELEYELRWTE